YLTGLPLPASIGISIGNTLEAFVAILLVKRLGRKSIQQLDSTITSVRFDHPVTTARGLSSFLVVMAVCTMISATIGTSCIYLSGLSHGASFQYLWWTWWLGDTAGGIVFAPFILAWTDSTTIQWTPRKIGEVLALLLLISLLGFLVFSGVPQLGSSILYATVP